MLLDNEPNRSTGDSQCISGVRFSPVASKASENQRFEELFSERLGKTNSCQQNQKHATVHAVGNRRESENRFDDAAAAAVQGCVQAAARQ